MADVEKQQAAVECGRGSRRLLEVIEALVEGAAPDSPESVDAEILNTFNRMLGIFRSMAALEGPEHYEAAATLAAPVFEMYVDLRLLSGDDTGDMLRRRIEYFDIQKFRAAHRIVSFHEESGGRTELDVDEPKRFREDSGGIEEIRKKVAEVWGPDNRGKSSYPVHWSGRKCTRVLCHEMGSECEELYIEAYGRAAGPYRGSGCSDKAHRQFQSSHQP